MEEEAPQTTESTVSEPGGDGVPAAEPERRPLFRPDPGEAEPEAAEAAPEGAESEPEAEPEPSVADRSWDALTRKEAEVQARQRELKSLETDLAPLRAIAQQLQSGDHLGAIKALGVDPRQALADYWGPDLVGGEPDKEPEPEYVSQMRKQLEETQKRLDELSTGQTKMQLHRHIRQAMQGADRGVVGLLVADQGEEALFDQLIEAAVLEQKQTGVAPSWSELLDRSEEKLTDRYAEDVKKLLDVPKLREAIQKHLAGSAPPRAAPAAKPAVKRAAADPAPTLTNDLGGEYSEQDVLKLPKAERRRLAEKRLKEGWRPEQ